jgi:hypothetical protein
MVSLACTIINLLTEAKKASDSQEKYKLLQSGRSTRLYAYALKSCIPAFVPSAGRN